MFFKNKEVMRRILKDKALANLDVSERPICTGEGVDVNTDRCQCGWCELYRNVQNLGLNRGSGDV